MINGLGVLGWGVGGIEAEAVMLGQPLYMLMPEVVGFELTGRLPEGATATDLVLTVTEMLRAKGVVGKFVEFFGPGLSAMTLPDRATAGQHGARVRRHHGLLPGRRRDAALPAATGRTDDEVELVERYAKEQGLFRTDDTPDPSYTDSARARPVDGRAQPGRAQAAAGPRAAREHMKASVPAGRSQRPGRASAASPSADDGGRAAARRRDREGTPDAARATARWSSPPSRLHQHLQPLGDARRRPLAKKAAERGLHAKPWVKTSLAPGSQVVTEYFDEGRAAAVPGSARFRPRRLRLHDLHRQRGPLPERWRGGAGRTTWSSRRRPVAATATSRAASTRCVKANYLATPPLVVAYALAGTRRHRPARPNRWARTSDGRPVYLADIWPTTPRSRSTSRPAMHARDVPAQYADVFEGQRDVERASPSSGGDLFDWDEDSTYIQEPPFFVDMPLEAEPITPIEGARVLVARRRLRHHRPHLAGRRHPAGQPGGRVPARARRRAEGLQHATARAAATTGS